MLHLRVLISICQCDSDSLHQNWEPLVPRIQTRDVFHLHFETRRKLNVVARGINSRLLKQMLSSTGSDSTDSNLLELGSLHTQCQNMKIIHPQWEESANINLAKSCCRERHKS